ncbi:tyrosine-protein phosphatase non-receptor type 20 isoform X1 [Prionailurus iriomotensis]
MSAPRKATAESENLESTNKHRNTRKAFAPGKDMEGEDSNLKDVISWESLPSSSQTPRSVTREVLAKEDSSEEVKFSPQSSQNDYEDILKDATESDSDPSIWATSGFLRDKWSSEDEELAGPSQTVPPQLHAFVLARLEYMGSSKDFLLGINDDQNGFYSCRTLAPPLGFLDLLSYSGIQIVSERELAQLAHVRPLIFSFHEQLTIKDCFNVLEKKVAEFEILQEFMTLDFQNLPGEFNSGNDLRNRDKNRYRDVLPYDSTRVPLGENKDYINASYIRIMNSGEEYFYIAAQGPLPSTTDDFWQMVLENNSNVIVMITKEIEGGVVKCHHYWPISMKKPLELKNCRIFMENYQILQCFIIRIFQVVRKSTGTSHFIKHLQFTNWPDHGTPAPVDGFIKYVRYVRKSHLTGPVLVHCSAGVGRTGVFLCVDVVFCAIEKNFPKFCPPDLFRVWSWTSTNLWMFINLP